MNIKKIVATAVLSVSLLTLGGADCIMDTQPVAHASAAEDALAGAVIGALIGAGCSSDWDDYDDYDYSYGYSSGYGYHDSDMEVVEVHHYYY